MIKNLVFSGGGLRGIPSYVGALKALEETGIIDGVQCYAGASIGAVFATLVSVGYTHQQLYEFVQGFQYEMVKDIKILRIMDTFGIESGDKVEKLIQLMIDYKTKSTGTGAGTTAGTTTGTTTGTTGSGGGGGLTFAEHYALFKKRLLINATCLETGQIEIFDHEKTPNLQISKALRMTISVPVLFTPVKWNDKTYVDGGLLDNFPIKYFDPEVTLGIRCGSNMENGTWEIDSFETFCYRSWECIYQEMSRMRLGDTTNYYVITINSCLNLLNITLTREQRRKAYKTGYTTVINYLQKKLGLKKQINNSLLMQFINILHPSAPTSAPNKKG